MKQKLLTDIELDVHGLKYLMDLYSKEPTKAVFELLKQNILHMQGCLDEVLQELEPVRENASVPCENASEPVVEEVMVETKVSADTETEEVKPSSVLGESIKASAGLRHSISLNDSFRFSRELFGVFNRLRGARYYKHGSHDPTFRAYKSKHMRKLNMSEYRHL